MSRYEKQRQQNSPAHLANTDAGSSLGGASRPSSQLMMRERVGEVLRRTEGMDAQQDVVSPDNKEALAEQGFATPEVALPHADVVSQGLGADLSGLKAHTDDASTEAMGAHAYMKGDHAVFSSDASVEDVAHEAAHYVQQNDGVQTRAPSAQRDPNGATSDPEVEAEAAAQSIAAGGSFEVGGSASPAVGDVHERDWSISGLISEGKGLLQSGKQKLNEMFAGDEQTKASGEGDKVSKSEPEPEPEPEPEANTEQQAEEQLMKFAQLIARQGAHSTVFTNLIWQEMLNEVEGFGPQKLYEALDGKDMGKIPVDNFNCDQSLSRGKISMDTEVSKYIVREDANAVFSNCTVSLEAMLNIRISGKNGSKTLKFMMPVEKQICSFEVDSGALERGHGFSGEFLDWNESCQLHPLMDYIY